ncbi:MAG: hypothetical protein QNJ40_09545 [Xanthomonadales bacterium]|nr:hypothetical protein [Xanthomonadales bacterium]
MKAWIVFAAALGFSTAVAAQETVRKDVLLIDRMAKTANRAVPVNGLSMTDVESRFGAPSSKQAPVGDPPIARWEYAEFTVYFEYDKVIHSVVRRATDTESLPKTS